MASYDEKEDARDGMSKLTLISSPLLPRKIDPAIVLADLGAGARRNHSGGAGWKEPPGQNESAYNLAEDDTICELPSFQRHEEATNVCYTRLGSCCSSSGLFSTCVPNRLPYGCNQSF
jgi:hypothetical protein